MAKKQITPEEFKNKMQKKADRSKRFYDAFLKTCALLLGCAILFGSTVVMVNRTESVKSSYVPASGENVTEEKHENSVDWDAPAEEPSKEEQDTEKEAESETDKAEEKNELATPREQLNYFLASFKKVKTDAKSAEKYWKNDTNYKGVVEAPAGLGVMAQSLMESNMESGDVTDEKYTGEDIKKYFPPKDGAEIDFGTKDVKSIELREDGEYYIITIVCRGGINLQNGKGAGAVTNLLSRNQIYDPISNIPVLKNIGEPTITYDSATCVAKIEKKTGNLVDYYTTLPLYLAFPKVNVKVGLQFEEKWRMEY